MLGRYEIVRLIGRGGMGSVYEAMHRDLRKRVAIKTLLPSLAVSQEAKQRFLREGEAASRIRHPNVVDVTDVVAEGPTQLPGDGVPGGRGSVRADRAPGRAAASTQTADIMLPVMAAIAAAHEQGVIHRDLKPENIFLASSHYGGMHPKVLDFGISKVLGDRALDGADRHVGDLRHHVLPAARAAPRLAPGRRQERSVRAGHHPLRVPDRPPRLRGRQPLRHAAEHRRGRSTRRRARGGPICRR